MRTIPELKEGTHRAKATGTLPNGKPVVVNSDGTVSVVAGSNISSSLGSATVFETTIAGFFGSSYDSNSNKVVFAYKDEGNSAYGTAVVGTISGTSISFGTPVVYASVNSDYHNCAFDSSNNKVVVGYNDNVNDLGKAIVGTVSGTSISFGSAVSFPASNVCNYISSVFDSNSNKVVFAYRDAGASQRGKAAVATVSGTSLSFGSAGTFLNTTGNGPENMCMAFDSVNNKVVLAFQDRNDSNKAKGIVGTVSGTNISFGSISEIPSSSADIAEDGMGGIAYDANSEKIVVVYRASSVSNYGRVSVGTVSGTSISFAAAATFAAFATGTGAKTPKIVYNPTAKKVVVVVEGASQNNLYEGVVSGDTVTFSSPLAYATSSPRALSNPVYASTPDKVVIGYQADNNNGTSAVYQTAYTSTNLTSENYIGISDGVVNSETVTQALGSVVDITNTAPEYIAMAFDENAGKVVVAYKLGGGTEYGFAAVGTVSGTSITFGTPVAYTSAALASRSQGIVFDSSSNKVVISYVRSSDNNGQAVVGTVSGDSISFGSATTFNAGITTWVSSVFDNSNNKVVISYSDGGNSDYGTAIVGTVSGTSISFGTEVVFESAEATYSGSTFDSANNKVVISYRDDGNTGKGTAIVGTVSGTSITFGTAALFNNASTYWTDTTFDSTNGKAVIIYSDHGNSQYGTAIVGTVSGTDITFGSEVVFITSATTAPVAAFDSSVGKITVAYRNSGNSNNTTIIPATVSGTSISFDSAVDVGIVNGGGESIGIVFDSTNNRNVIAFKDDTANDNSAVVFRNAGTITTRGQVNDGSSATVDIIGSVSTNQSGLTAGQSYYVQTDGTIGETAGDPSVFAGTAISATSLVVKT